MVMPPKVLTNRFFRAYTMSLFVILTAVCLVSLFAWSTNGTGGNIILILCAGVAASMSIRCARAGWIRFGEESLDIRALGRSYSVEYSDIKSLGRKRVSLGLRTGEAPVMFLNSGKRIALVEMTASNSSWKVWKKDYRLVEAVEKEIAARIAAIGDTEEGGNS